ncbi:MAG: transketolase family protein, partial [Anaerolineae bacterium]|nr:transketolase family protein [Anaerolineae bacterium]
MSELHDCRKAFANALEDVARMDPRVVVLSNDSVSSASLSHFAEVFPGRLFNVGIAEQNMVGMASGMANGGKMPFVAAAACFLTGRALEQIKADVAYTGTNVKLCGVSPGLAYGPLGGTHHSIEDIAWLRAIANMTIIVPADPLET